MSWRRGQTYSQDLRDRVSAARGSARRVAERFGVSASYVVKARQRRARTGCVTPRPQRPPVVRRVAHLHEAVAAQMMRPPETTIAELREWLLQEQGSGPAWGPCGTHSPGSDRRAKKSAPHGRTGACRRRRSTPRLAPAAAWAEARKARVPG